MIALVLAAAAAVAAPSDAPRDYTHTVPLTVSAKAGVAQLQVPRGVYLHARSASLNDVRVFDAQGVAQPFALRQPQTEAQTSRMQLPVRVFPLLAEQADTGLAGLEVSTGTDGRVLSVRLPGTQDTAARPRQRLAALVLDLRQDGIAEPPLVDALRFTLPPGRTTYAGQVWLESSDDLKRWDTIGVAELGWLANASEESLANDRLEFSPRPMRYARLSWRGGEPVHFASVQAESPVRTQALPATESLTLQPREGREPRDLVYIKPPGITPIRAGLQFDSDNIVLPATLGKYRELRKGDRYRFDPAVRTTFYRLVRDGKPRESGDISVPAYLGNEWVLRFEQPPQVKPALRVSWQPANIVFLAGGTPPYTLAVGRDKALPAARDIADVAPGFTPDELRSLEKAGAGAVQAQRGVAAAAAAEDRDAKAAAQRRMALLWGVLLMGVAAVGAMVWRLLRQPAPQGDGPAA